MASEDSDLFSPGLLSVHRLRDLQDLDEAVPTQMPVSGHHLDASSELHEVLRLRRPKRMRSEEWDNDVKKVLATVDGVRVHMLSVVVVPCIAVDTSDCEIALQLVEGAQATFPLHHHEIVRHLVTGPSSILAWL